MGSVRGVLVVPADGDPGGLLRCGVCATGAPATASLVDGVWLPALRCDEAGTALPLWWDGTLVPEGWDRLRRVLARLGRASTYLGIESLSDVADVIRAAEYAVAAGLGARVVLVDADGREC